MKTRVACRVCDGSLEPILSLGEHYVSDFIKPGESDGVQAPLEIVLCLRCRLLQLKHTVPAESMYQNYWYLLTIAIYIIMLVMGYVLIKKSEYFAGKIIKDETNIENNTNLSRKDIIAVAIVVMSVDKLIMGFFMFFSELYSIFLTFISDYPLFMETFKIHLQNVLKYVLIIIIFLKSRNIAEWIDAKVLTNNKQKT